MQRARHRSVRRLQSLLLVALLLVPLAFSGHRHTDSAAQSGSCATCLLVHHLPAAPAPVAAHAAPVFVARTLPGSLPAVLTADARPVAVGRAPPLVSASPSA